MRLNSFYPVLMRRNVETSANFFIELFDFKVTFTSEWYVGLKNNRGFELALIDSSHETIPDKYRANCQGIILNFEVESVDEVFSQIKNRGDVSVLMEVKDEEFGQRHFMLESPDEIIIDVIQITPPSAGYSDNYTDTEKDYA